MLLLGFICNFITAYCSAGKYVNFEDTAYTVGEGNGSLLVCLEFSTDGGGLSAMKTVHLQILMGNNSMYLAIVYISIFYAFLLHRTKLLLYKMDNNSIPYRHLILRTKYPKNIDV